MPTVHKTITWQAPEFQYYHKNIGWYVTVIAIIILIIAFFVLQSDLFAAITTGILGIFIILFSFHRPAMVTIELTHRGIWYGTIFYPFKQIKHFWIVHNDHHRTLNIETTTYMNNMLILELAGQDPEDVREYLLPYLPEHHSTQETFAQRISHRLKF